MLKGIDISVDQYEIDFDKVKANDGISFVYAKCTEGLTYIDAQFDRNIQELRRVGIPGGAYHFFHPADDPIGQAEHFLNATDDHGSLIPMVDVEVTDGVAASYLVENLAKFLNYIEPKFGSKRALIYTGYSFWKDSVQGSDAFSGHPLWISEYNSDPAPTLPPGWTEWMLWQHADDGILEGISTTVDLDVLNPAYTLKSITR